MLCQASEKSIVSSVVLQLEVKCMHIYFLAMQFFQMLHSMSPHSSLLDLGIRDV